ncbi:MAG: hypothetical protein ACRBFS_27520, partial [Aureispira sp.]
KSTLRGALSCLSFLFFSLATITAQTYTTVTVTVQEASCPNDLGSIELSPELPGTYTYLWNTGATTALIDNLPMGKYQCTVTVDNGTPEVITASTYRSWDLGRLVPTDNTLSIVGNAVTVDPNLPSQNHADQRLHVYDKTPVDIENTTGSIFAQFTNNHPNFPTQTYNPNKPGVFYIELFEKSTLDARELHHAFFFHNAFGILTKGTNGEILVTQERQTHVSSAATATGYTYTAGEELEVRFLGNHQLEVYLEGVLIHTTTLPQKASNEYIIAVGFNDKSTLDRRVAYNLKSSFCTDMPLVKKVVNHSQKYSANGSIALELIEPNYLSGSYTYLWNNGATTHQLSSLSKGDYVVTLTNNTGITEVVSTTIDEKLRLQANDPQNTILTFLENSMTVEPLYTREASYDYKSFGYDPELIIEADPAQPQSIKWWVSDDHSNFPTQQYNTDLLNAVFYIGLHPVQEPMASTTDFRDLPFKVVVTGGGKFYFIDNVGTTPSSNFITPIIRHHQEGMAMEWRFVGNRVVEFYINDLLVATKSLPGTDTEYYWTAGFNEQSHLQRRIVHDVRTS